MIARDHHRYDAGIPAFKDRLRSARARRIDEPRETGEGPLLVECRSVDIARVREVLPECERKNPVAATGHIVGGFEQRVRQRCPALAG